MEVCSGLSGGLSVIDIQDKLVMPGNCSGLSVTSLLVMNLKWIEFNESSVATERQRLFTKAKM